MGCGAGKEADKGAAEGQAAAKPSPKEEPESRARICIPKWEGNTDARAQGLAAQKAAYAWYYDTPGLPPAVREVPEMEATNYGDNSDARFRELVKEGLGVTCKLKASNAVAGLINKLSGHGRSFATFEEFFDCPGAVPCPEVAKRWREDATFADMRLNGINNGALTRCTSLPAGCAWDEGSAVGGHTVGSLMKAGRLYVCDYKFLEGIGCPADRFLDTPLAFFWKDDAGVLMPAAIQLEQVPTAPVFLPSDPETVWLAAKMKVSCADINSQSLKAHLWPCHFALEAIYVSMMQQVHVNHPVNQLLRPHFFFTVFMNDRGRAKLANPDGPMATAMSLGPDGVIGGLRKAAKEFKFDDLDVPQDIARRGVGPDVLPGSLWAADARKLWNVIEKYVSLMVGDFYQTDASVAEDPEVQAWLAVVRAPYEQSGAGIPSAPKVASRADLSAFITKVMYTATGAHAAVNNGQFATAGFVPAMPALFRLPAEKIRQDKPLSEADVAAACPDDDISFKQIRFLYVLSSTWSSDIKVGAYGPGFMKDRHDRSKASVIAAGFARDLEELSKDIQARNGRVAHPYLYLDPAQVLMSVQL
eukprot:TRINITY_DN5402_c1_g1_i1.p1 TRINITY_DN5402_c1_g1~~TRINITY_DN5402_c1_g1_i1.p1  ORF type:complete len:587 (+),score=207.21 TRINITY_DN5402_c1_g1_i1:57-1817(+)